MQWPDRQDKGLATALFGFEAGVRLAADEQLVRIRIVRRFSVDRPASRYGKSGEVALPAALDEISRPLEVIFFDAGGKTFQVQAVDGRP
jgi:hypothetical protein